ncbi:MAG: hypothetical protein AAF804_18145, partial [Bacteroidota bacterium]
MAHLESLQGAKFPPTALELIQYASERGITVRFALMSEVYELMNYDQLDVFTTYNRNIPVEQLITYYGQSHRDHFGQPLSFLPFATSINHYHEDKADFLAVVRDSSRWLDGRILYSNIDYTLERPALVAPSFNSLFPEDWKAKIDRAQAVGDKVVFFGLKDFFPIHAFEYPLTQQHEVIESFPPEITADSSKPD